MVFMTNVWENMAIQMCGKFLLNYLIIYHWLLLWKTKYFVCMVAYRRQLIVLIKLDNLIELKKFHKKVLCVIYSGLTLMKTD